MGRFFQDDLLKSFNRCCQEALEKEVDWGTVNHYFTSKFDVERQLPDALVTEFVQAFKQDHFLQNGSFSLQHAQTQMRKLLVERKKMFEERFKSLSMHQQQQIRLFHAIRAWYS